MTTKNPADIHVLSMPSLCKQTATVKHNGPAPTKALVQLQRALDVCRDRASFLPVDGALDLDPMGAFATWRDFGAVEASWLSAIATDELREVKVPEGVTSLAIDPRDGALVRVGGGGGVAVLPHASNQLVNLALHGEARERNVGNVLHHQLNPPARSLAWEDVREASKRSKPTQLRLYRNAQHSVMTLRAVLSERYPVGYFDDEQLVNVVAEVVDVNAQASVVRGVFETRGRAVLDVGSLKGTGAVPVLNWRNSETGNARLGFWAGLRITVLDEVVQRRVGTDAFDVETVTEKTVEVAATQTRTERNHTLPWARISEGERRRIANERMRASRDRAIEHVLHLAAQWGVACEDFPRGFDSMAERSGLTVEVLVDMLLEGGHIEAEQRDAVLAIMMNEKRLPLLGQGSAAYIAGVFACLGRAAKTMAEQDEAQSKAGEWVAEGWAGEGTGVMKRRLAREAVQAKLDRAREEREASQAALDV